MQNSQLRGSVKSNILFILLVILSLVFVGVNFRINYFSYNNFDYGKFDLGNMSQMIWNTTQGRFMYLTDYFGTNMPRWGMSHVDPIILLLLPVFVFIPSPLMLIFSQVILLTLSAFVIYATANLLIRSNTVAFLVSASYLFYPALGYLAAKTTFHGVSIAVFFFLCAFYVFERMYADGRYSRGRMILFSLLLAITMSGKEQLPLYVFMYGIFILFFRNPVLSEISYDKQFVSRFFRGFHTRMALTIMAVSFTWFYLAFFVIIPKYAYLRADGYARFARNLGLEGAQTRDVDLPNYFLSRYEAFGDSYADILIGMLKDHRMAIQIFFGGDKLDNFHKTLGPLGYLPLFAPHIFMMAVPDFLINYLTSVDGIGTSEITNHRISMIIPVMFLSLIFFYKGWFLVVGRIGTKFPKYTKALNSLKYILPTSIFILSIYSTFQNNNPVYLWLTQAVSKRLSVVALAKVDQEVFNRDDLVVGSLVRLSPLEYKDRECARRVIEMIPVNASVSGPDYLGAHLSLRETYAIFPALYNEADYVIVDVFSKKILNILDVESDLIKDIVKNLIKDPNYSLQTGCGNLFVFKRILPGPASHLLPIQERYKFSEAVNFEMLKDLYVVDFAVPSNMERGKESEFEVTYVKRSSTDIKDNTLFLSFMNSSTGELYQAANLPSFAIRRPGDWEEGMYYTENLKLTIPSFIDSGSYKVFVGMYDNIRTRSLYLGDTRVE